MTEQPMLIFDGDCGFCTRAVTLIFQRLRPRAEAVRYQSVDLARYGATEERARHEVLWTGGELVGGVRAFSRLLRTCDQPWAALGVILGAPPVRWVAHVVYRLIANNRHRMPGGTDSCALRITGRP
jgi:predicted DCC family thiol-disulfide oxidoreductase YuxK